MHYDNNIIKNSLTFFFMEREFDKSTVFIANLFQVNLFKCQDTVDSSASGYPCVTICPPGYECSFGVCKPETCKNCSATNDSSPVCGSGTTYANLCELEKARCETGKDIRLERNGPCKLLIT